MRTAGDGDIEAVLIVATTGRAPAPRRRLRRPKPAAADPASPAAIALTTLTVVEAAPLAREPDEWLAALRKDEEERERYLERALGLVRRALGAARVAAADASVGELPAGAAVRIGYADGEQLVAGRWGDALAIPPAAERRSRAAALRPGERFAALLGGREDALPCEELALRAAADVAAGRGAAAALQTRVAVEAVLAARAELGGGQDRDLARLEDLRPELERAAQAALADPGGEPSDPVREAVTLAQRVLRRRAANR